MGKSYFSSHESALQECRAGGAPFRTDALIGPAACGRCPKNGQFKTTRECARSLSWLSWLSWTWLDSLELCGTPRSYASRFRNCALQRAPVRWTLTSEPTIGRSLRPCQSRNGATNSTTAEESFPGDVTRQRSKPAEFFQSNTWKPTWKRNQSIQPV